MKHVKKAFLLSLFLAFFCSTATQVHGNIGFGVGFGGPFYQPGPRYYTGFSYGPTWGPCYGHRCSDGDVVAAGALGLVGGLAAGAAFSNSNNYKSAEELELESEYAQKDHEARLERKRKRLEALANRKKARIDAKEKRRKEHEELQSLDKTFTE